MKQAFELGGTQYEYNEYYKNRMSQLTYILDKNGIHSKVKNSILLQTRSVLAEWLVEAKSWMDTKSKCRDEKKDLKVKLEIYKQRNVELEKNNQVLRMENNTLKWQKAMEVRNF